MNNIGKIALLGAALFLGAQPFYAKNPFKKVAKAMTKKIVQPVQKTVAKNIAPVKQAIKEQKQVFKDLNRMADHAAKGDFKSAAHEAKAAYKNQKDAYKELDKSPIAHAVMKEGWKQIKATAKDGLKVEENFKAVAKDAKATYKHAKAFGKNQGKAFNHLGESMEDVSRGDFKSAKAEAKKYGKYQARAGKELGKAGMSAMEVYNGTLKGLDSVGYMMGGIVTGHDPRAQQWVGGIMGAGLVMAASCPTGPGVGCYRAIGNIAGNRTLDLVLNGTPLGKEMDKNKYTRAIKQLAPDVVNIASDAYAMNCLTSPQMAVNSIGGAAMCGSVVPKFVSLAKTSKEVHESLWHDKKGGTKYAGTTSLKSGVPSYNPGAPGGSLIGDDRAGELFNRAQAKTVHGVVRVAKVSTFARAKEAKLAELRAMEQ